MKLNPQKFLERTIYIFTRFDIEAAGNETSVRMINFATGYHA